VPHFPRRLLAQCACIWRNLLLPRPLLPACPRIASGRCGRSWRFRHRHDCSSIRQAANKFDTLKACGRRLLGGRILCPRAAIAVSGWLRRGGRALLRYIRCIFPDEAALRSARHFRRARRSSVFRSPESRRLADRLALAVDAHGEENIREAFQETLACALLECPARSRHRPTLDDRAAQCWLHIG